MRNKGFGLAVALLLLAGGSAAADSALLQNRSFWEFSADRQYFVKVLDIPGSSGRIVAYPTAEYFSEKGSARLWAAEGYAPGIWLAPGGHILVRFDTGPATSREVESVSVFLDGKVVRRHTPRTLIADEKRRRAFEATPGSAGNWVGRVAGFDLSGKTFSFELSDGSQITLDLPGGHVVDIARPAHAVEKNASGEYPYCPAYRRAAFASQTAEHVGDFGLRLYQELSAGGQRRGNVVLSPLGLSTVLAAVAAGADRQTEQQIERVLGAQGRYGSPSLLLQAMALLSEASQARFPEAKPVTVASTSGSIEQPSQPIGNDKLAFAVRSAVWVRQGVRLSDAYRRTLESYGCQTHFDVDFSSPGRAALLREISRFAAPAAAADGQEPSLVGQADLSDRTRLLLANSVEFRGLWARHFDPRNTRPGRFWVSPSRSVRVQMMYQTECPVRILDREQDDFLAVEIEYRKVDHSLVLFLPRAVDGLAAWDGRMTGNRLAGFLADLDKAPVTTARLYLPRFDVQNRYALEPALAALGMTLAFDPAHASFAGVSGPDVAIDRLIHQCRIAVDEEGTCASAATVVAFATIGGTPNLVQFDHPFFFLVRDRRINSFLFLGRVVDPAAGS
jgi:serine protease inhibitor